MLQNLVEEVRPHDDTAWEAYIQWYTLRTRARVMYVPPHLAAPVPDAMTVLASTVYSVRWDQHYDTAAGEEEAASGVGAAAAVTPYIGAAAAFPHCGSS
jgi:hypothetical protein